MRFVWKKRLKSIIAVCLTLAMILPLATAAVTKAETLTKEVTYDVFSANTLTIDNGQVASVAANTNWNANLAASENVDLLAVAGWHGTDGYEVNNNDTNCGVYSVDPESSGYATFKVPAEDGAKITKLILNTRFCAGSGAPISISDAVDGNYTEIYKADDSTSGYDKEVDISTIAADWSEVYVKAYFGETMCADWSAIYNIRAIGVVEEKGIAVENDVAIDVFSANTVIAENGQVASTALNEAWDANLVASENVKMQASAGWYGTDGNEASNHDSRSALYSEAKESAGYAIFKVPAKEGVTITKLVVNSRFCAGSSATTSISNAIDGTYKDIYTATDATSGRDQEIDIAADVADWSEIYVKVSFAETLCTDWSAVWNIRAIGTEKEVFPVKVVTESVDVFSANTMTVENNQVASTVLNEAWDANLVASENVKMQTSAGWYGTEGYEASNHDSRSALYSEAKESAGYAIFKVPVEAGATVKKLIVNSRFCAGSGATTSISNAVDGIYKDIYTATDATSGRDQEIDIAADVADWSEIYVKVSFAETACTDWAAVWNIRAITEKEVADTGEDDTPEVEYEENPTDQVDSAVVTWEIGSEDKYDLTSDSISRKTVTATAGNVSENYNVAVLEAGKSMEFTLPAEVGTDTNIAMEIREIHMHGDADITYDVALNGTTVSTREVTPLSEGATHVWFDFNKNILGETNKVTITNTGEQAIRFESVWFYENLEALLIEEDIYRPMEVVLFTLPVKYKDYDTDLATVLDYKAKYSGYEKYTIGMAFDIFYMKWETETLYERIDWLMQLSADSDMPLYLDLNSWWSGTSNGMDGQGGFWKDLNYQQIIYDPQNVNGQGEWQLSTPNMWSNTPWLSLNNDWYNQVRNEKLKAVSDYISMKQAEYEAKGTPVDVHIFMENEPIYWAYKHYNGTTADGRADLSYLVIEDAKADGLNLDPTDGLSGEEQLWLFNNLTDYIDAEGDAVAEGLGSDAIVIVDGEVTYPSSQLSEKAFSHIATYNHNESTTVDGVLYPFWEWHTVDNLRLGLEYAKLTEMSDTDLTYVAARGTYADVNIERSAISNFAVLNQLYRYGADYAILFNIYSGDEAQVEKVDSPLSEIPGDVAMRSKNLWITCRADVERLLDEIGNVTNSSAQALLTQAKEAYANGRYNTAYELLMQVESTGTLPVDFAVSGTSTLLDYPVTVETVDGEVVNVTLYSAGNTLKLKLTAETSDEVKVTWNGVNSYTVKELGNGIYEFAKGGSQSGSATLTCAPYCEKDYPDQFEAVLKGKSGDNFIAITSQDASIGEYVDSVGLYLAEDCTITREADGDTSSKQEVALSELQNFDLLYLTLNENDEVTSIRAVYGLVVGRVVSVTYPVVDGTQGLENPYITIKEADGTVHEFEICSITGFSYPTMTGSNMQTSDLTDYGLTEGDKIKISYSPYQWQDSSLKALKVYKDDYNKTVVNLTFEDGELGENTVAENVYVTRLDGNYANKVATPEDKSKVGSMTWEITQDDNMPIGDITISHACRSYSDTTVTYYMSTDNGETWTVAGQDELNEMWQSTQTILIENIEANSVLIKAEMDPKDGMDPDTWTSIDKIIISIPSADLVAARAVDELIMAIGEVNENSGDAIKAARAAYDALTDAQKPIAENDDILIAAEKTYEELMNQGKPGTGEDDQNKPGTGEDDQNKPGIGEDDQNKPGIGEDDQNKPGAGENNQSGTDNNPNGSNQNNNQSSDKTDKDSVNTGDNANIMLYVVMLALAALCAGGVLLVVCVKRQGR